MREKVPAYLDQARALTLLAAGAGLVFWMDPLAANPLSPKTFLFASAAGLFAAFSAMRLWWGAKIWLPRNRAGAALLIVLASQGLAFFVSESHGRSEAAFNGWLLVALLGFASFDWTRDEGRQSYLMSGLAVLMGLSSLWALSQLSGHAIAPMDAAMNAAFGKRVSAGFGNPNFLAGFLVLTLPCALWLALRRPAAWALVALGAFAILATGSKAAWLGLGFEFFCFGHLHWHSSRPREARLKFLKLWAALGLGVGLFFLALLPSARARLIEGMSLKHESVQFRIQTWKGALSAFAARPVFGHGPGSFSAIYPNFRPVAAMASQVQHSYEVTHPENWVLQMLVESGVGGLAALLYFLWLLLSPLWKKSLESDPLALALFLALAGSLTCNLASLDLFLPSTFFFFTLLAALALRHGNGGGAGVGILAEGYASAMLSLCLLFLASFPSLQNLASWRASRDLLKARGLSETRHFDEAIKAYDLALQGDPINTEALYFKGATFIDMGKPADALPVFAELQALALDYVLVHDKKARALKALGKLDEAAAEWERQIELDPWMLPAIQELSGLYAGQGKLADAERILNMAESHYPGSPDIQRNLKLIRGKLKGTTKKPL